MNVCYLDFWPGFDINCNWFNLLFSNFVGKENFNVTTNPEEADLLFASSFGKSRYTVKNLKAVRIFYTGENERPDLDFGDYSLSFDPDTQRNFRLPHWYMYINWWDEPNFPHARISKDQLIYRYDSEDIWNREHFCSIVIGNPVQNRIETALALNSMKPVHGYGKVFGKPFDGCKVKLLSNYRWNICFENSITDGYITEKLLEAKIAGCIPIYYGPDISLDFNPNCAFNVAQLNLNPDEIKELVYSIENDKEIFLEKAAEPLFNETPSLDELYNFLRRIIR